MTVQLNCDTPKYCSVIFAVRYRCDCVLIDWWTWLIILSLANKSTQIDSNKEYFSDRSHFTLRTRNGDWSSVDETTTGWNWVMKLWWVARYERGDFNCLHYNMLRGRVSEALGRSVGRSICCRRFSVRSGVTTSNDTWTCSDYPHRITAAVIRPQRVTTGAIKRLWVAILSDW